MDKPKHGFILQGSGGWFFCAGLKTSNPLIPLPHFEDIAPEMIQKGHLAQHHCKLSKFIQLRSKGTLRQFFSRCISAANLHSHKVPTLLRHHTLSPSDWEVWDAAYTKEYDGLTSLPCWQCISKQEYNNIKTTQTKLLPTMAISTIKFDNDGLQKRAKYCIVGLGNLDPITWTKSDVYAPVMSLLELRFINSLAVKKYRTLKMAMSNNLLSKQHFHPTNNMSFAPQPGVHVLLPKHIGSWKEHYMVSNAVPNTGLTKLQTSSKKLVWNHAPMHLAFFMAHRYLDVHRSILVPTLTNLFIFPLTMNLRNHSKPNLVPSHKLTS